MPNTTPNFPFTAICGQSAFKKALILAAIDPAIGGVLVSGPRGVAKSTLAKAFFDIIPQDGDQTRFVHLPLGSSEEMLTGTLDLEKVMQDQKVAFKEGLLAKAHKGVLYVDEVNLLADNLVDLLLDVSASQVNHIERDGVSHSHASRFILIGTMNPDEGELRPQLLDRFGLMINLDNNLTLDERVEIVDKRHAFDHDPQAFCQQYAEQQAQLTEAINSARLHLNKVIIPRDMKFIIAEKCQASGADGIRADLVLTRAVKAHCAWQGRSEVCLDDIEQVLEMVLCHRRKQQPPSPGSQNKPPQNTDSGFKRPEGTRHQGEQPTETDQAQGDWGAMSANHQVAAVEKSFTIPEIRAHSRVKAHSTGRNKSKGYSVTGNSVGKASSSIDWFQTILKNPEKLQPDNVVYQQKRSGKEQLHCVLLDTSGSTLTHQLLKEAKSFVLVIQKHAYLAREKLCIFSFGNQEIKEIQAFSKSPKQLGEKIDAIMAGGGTPLRDMLITAEKMLTQRLKQHKSLSVTTYLITDGRTNQSVAGLRIPGETIVVDTEAGSLKVGRCRQIADALGAEYLPLLE